MIISSLQNPEIKNIIKLSTKKRERQKQQLFVVEGIQENEYALKNGFKPYKIFVESDLFNKRIKLPSSVETIEISPQVYQKTAYRGSSEGIIGIYEMPNQNIDFKKSNLILILEGLEKPGNLGAIIRSSLAFGVDGIVLTEESVDIYNPNVIRSSVGTVFTIPIKEMSNEDAFNVLKSNDFTIYGTDMHQHAVELENIDFEGKTSLLFGTEHNGLSAFWKDKIDINYMIPMQSELDSLNLSNAVAISLYQYRTQKKPIAEQ